MQQSHRLAHWHEQCKSDTKALHRVLCGHEQPQGSCSHSQAATLTEAAALHATRTGANLLFLMLKNFISGHTVLNSTGSEPVRKLSA